MLKNKTRRFGVAALAVAAAAAITLGGAGAANAVSGSSNQGVSNVLLTPLDGAVNFDTPGTTGQLTFQMGDGSANTGSLWGLAVGDQSAYQFRVGAGLRFLGSSPVCPTDLYVFATTTCELSADQTLWIVESIVHTPVTNSPIGWAGKVGPDWLVVSTGSAPVTTGGLATFTDWYTPGTTSHAQDAEIVLYVAPANETPLLAGGLIAALGLGGAGAVYGWRRQKKAAA